MFAGDEFMKEISPEGPKFREAARPLRPWCLDMHVAGQGSCGASSPPGREGVGGIISAETFVIRVHLQRVLRVIRIVRLFQHRNRVAERG